MKIGVISLGCPKNLADTESVVSYIKNFKLYPLKDAEVILLNTCGFLKKSRDEVFEHLNKLKNKKVVILGCLASKFSKNDLKRYKQIFAVVSGINYSNIQAILNAMEKGHKVYAVSKEPDTYELEGGKMLLSSSGFAYVKIAEGCNNKCSYCLIPSLKGRFRSRKMEDIIAEAENLIKIGIKELILVAQDCGPYGMDLYGEKKLPALLEKLEKIEGKFWIRMLYIYPETIDEKLLKILKSSKKILPYLDIPLQHGDPGILKKMNRPNNINKTLKKISKIKEILPGVTLRTSLIVGFPGETEKAFENLKNFVQKINFDHVGVFEYSREKGTPSYSLKPQISENTKQKRRTEIMLMQQKISLKNNKELIGKTFEILIENFDAKKKLYTGRIPRFAPEIDGLVYLKSTKKLKLNEFYKTKIKTAYEYDIFGDLI